jgi:hypothetical protein
VVATDLRGQRSSSVTRSLRLDGTPPRLRLRVSGSRSAGAALTFVAHASDRRSGVARVRFDFGDGGAVAIGSHVHHAFRAGSFTVTVTATDRAGNATVVTRALTVR